MNKTIENNGVSLSYKYESEDLNWLDKNYYVGDSKVLIATRNFLLNELLNKKKRKKFHINSKSKRIKLIS
jgi:hypothetical protein